MSMSSKNVEERLSSLASDIHNSIQQQMKDNVEEILECAESNCPFVTEQQVPSVNCSYVELRHKFGRVYSTVCFACF